MQNLILGIVILLLGPILWNLFQNKGLLPWVNRITALCVGFLVGIHILPESYEVIGYWSFVAAFAGFIIFFLLEYLWFLPKKNLRKVSVTFVLLGLCLHMILDGVGLAHGGHGHGHHHHDHDGDGGFLTWAILIHRLPAGLLLWNILKETFSARISWAFYGVFIVLTAAGYFVGEEVLHVLGSFQLQIMQSFIAGALAHVVVDCLIPHKGICKTGHAH